jgi:WD40 repeat protein
MHGLKWIVAGFILLAIATASAHAQVAVSPDGKLVASGEGKAIEVKEAASKKILMKMLGHTDKVTSLVYTPEGRMLVSGSADKSVAVWDAPTGRLIRRINTGVTVAGVESDGKLITVVDLDKKKRSFQIATGAEVPAK